jgi:hypothetical protein
MSDIFGEWQLGKRPLLTFEEDKIVLWVEKEVKRLKKQGENYIESPSFDRVEKEVFSRIEKPYYYAYYEYFVDLYNIYIEAFNKYYAPFRWNVLLTPYYKQPEFLINMKIGNVDSEIGDIFDVNKKRMEDLMNQSKKNDDKK